MLLGHKERRVIRYFLIPVGLLIIGSGITYFAGGQFTDMLVAGVKYAAIQSNSIDGQTDNTVDFSDITEGSGLTGDWTAPKFGKQYGEIRCNEVGLKVPLYYGDTQEILEKGVGQSVLSVFPGQTGTTLVGGHDTTFFAPLEKVEQGMDIVVNTSYGRYTYTVDEISVIEGADYDIQDKGQQLVMYTCYPFGKVEDDRSSKILYVCSLAEAPVTGGGTGE